MTEQWIQGHVLQRIMFRDGLVLNLDHYNELVISAPMELTVPPIAGETRDVFPIDPMAVRREQKPLEEVLAADAELQPYLEKMTPLQRQILGNPSLYTGIAAQKARSVAERWKEKFKL